MPLSRIAVIDRQTGASLTPCPDASLVMSNEDSGWQGVVLEQHRLAPAEIPEIVAPQHFVVVNLSSEVTLEYGDRGRSNPCSVAPGAICVIPQGSVYSVRWQDPIDFLVMALPDVWLQGITQGSTGQDRVELVWQRGLRDRLVRSIALTLREEAQTGAGEPLYHDALLQALGLHVLSKYGTQMLPLPVYAGGLPPAKKAAVIDYIQANLEQPLTLQAMATVVGLSQYHFAHQFKQSMGVAPYHYVLQCRIERAKTLLRQSQQSISSIAQACGFKSASYFTRQFRQIVGTTPKRYREQLT